MRDDDKAFMTECFLCHSMFQFGPHIYSGKAQPAWGGIMLCDGCCKGNWDGIVPGPRVPTLVRAPQGAGHPDNFEREGVAGYPQQLPPLVRGKPRG